MASYSKHLKLFGLGLSGLALLGLSACDNRQERIDSARNLGQAVIDQLLSNETVDSAQRLESVPVEARAMAGEIQAIVAAAPVDMNERRYAIGSIVAKPRDLEPMIAMADVMESPELADSVLVDDQAEAKIVVLDREMTRRAEADPTIIEDIEKVGTPTRSITVVDPKAPMQTRSLNTTPLPRKRLSDEIYRQQRADRGLPTPEPVRTVEPRISREQQIQAMPVLRAKVAQRALAPTTDTLVKQLSAEDRMIETATKYGVAASIQRSRSGQMVIEIGADAMKPTQFTAESAPQLSFGIE